MEIGTIPFLQIGKLGLAPEKYLTQKNPSTSSCSNCRMADYFKDIDPQMLSELKELYRVDFEMFGYEFNVWTNYYYDTCKLIKFWIVKKSNSKL